ncbi:hypothetical protein J2128_002506 [Methanomicrobium sp. W14]|uniref:hypothetical protein n=1 Tax=Methanomicrobium sp. W14 TaxID=2817839 RepID=UPI001AE15B94|nr:hypothetical protein [Methanomicrobium sp. W14]MBP2134535.1 hypothetical protein [Methanomicrobium sp. W14]
MRGKSGALSLASDLTDEKRESIFKAVMRLLTVSILIFFLFMQTASAEESYSNSELFSEGKYISPGFTADIGLEPVPLSGGTLAKGQPLTLNGKGDPDSLIGVWLYKNDLVPKDRNVFVKFRTGENGCIEGDGIILNDTQSEKLFSGEYFLYIVSGDEEFINSGYFPDTYTKLESGLNERESTNPYMKVVILSKVPWIMLDQKNIPDIDSGTPLTLNLSGKTNLAEGTRLIITVDPVLTDNSYFKDQIIEDTYAEADVEYQRWQKNISTDGFGPGEYTLSVEAAEYNAYTDTIFTVRNEVYSEKPSNDSLLVKSYSVDPTTKDISKNPEEEAEYTLKGPGEPEKSPFNMAVTAFGLIAGAKIFPVIKNRRRRP